VGARSLPWFKGRLDQLMEEKQWRLLTLALPLVVPKPHMEDYSAKLLPYTSPRHTLSLILFFWLLSEAEEELNLWPK